MQAIPLLTMEQMREIERRLADEFGHTLLSRVEQAGQALADTARLMVNAPDQEGDILVIAGPGDNGAVGLAAARRLFEAGASVRLILSVAPPLLHDMAAHQYTLLKTLGMKAWGLSMSEEELATLAPIPWTSAALIIDALYDDTVNEDPRGEAADLIRLVNASRRPVLAFGVPSGLGGDDGLIYSPCVEATATLTLGAPRLGLAEGWPVVGELWVADIGVPAALFTAMDLPVPDIFDGKPVVSLGSARALRS